MLEKVSGNFSWCKMKLHELFARNIGYHFVSGPIQGAGVDLGSLSWHRTRLSASL